MKYQLEHRVLIARAADKTFDHARLGQEGVIVRIFAGTEPKNEEESPEGLLYLVEFGDGQRNPFWGEELELVRLVAPA